MDSPRRMPRYYFSEQKLIQGSRHLRPLREEAGRSWEKLRTWKRYAPVPFVCPHHLGQPVHSYNSSAPSSANTFLDAFSQKRNFWIQSFQIFFWDIKLINRWTSTKIFVGHLITWESQVQKAAEKQTSRNKNADKTFHRKMFPPTLPKWLKMRKLQREAASEKSGPPWISGASLCDFLGLDFCLQLGGNHGAKSLHRSWATKLRVLEVSTRRFTKSVFLTAFTEIPWDSRRFQVQRVCHFNTSAIRPHHMCHLMCSLSLRSSGRDSGREK